MDEILHKMFHYHKENDFDLYNGGKVRLKRSEIQAVSPKYENTLVTCTNGKSYLLKGRGYGV